MKGPECRIWDIYGHFSLMRVKKAVVGSVLRLGFVHLKSAGPRPRRPPCCPELNHTLAQEVVIGQLEGREVSCDMQPHR